MRIHPFQFTPRAGLLLAGLALVACDPNILLGKFDKGGTGSQPGDQDSNGDGGDQDSNDDGEDEDSNGDGGGSSTSGQQTGGESSDDSGGGPGDAPCDAWLQDCPTGQKCAPYYTGGADYTWDAWHCVDLDPTPQSVGSSCHMADADLYSGEDDCELGAMCWDVDPETLEGHCIALCQGSPQAPTCDAGFHCAVLNDGVFNICLPDCDPLAQDCAAGEACIPLPDTDTFICVLDAGGAEGQAFDPCEFANACDPGLYCAAPDAASECSQTEPGCCIPFCDLDAVNPCPGAGQTCLPWYEPNEAPAGKEDTGVCGLAP